ncbi:MULTISPECIES: hypothetical protein [Klebsiella]|uniref:hypothetical protein n=1 Tax=Klebsiella pneumoniae complex TaxID=3390273 RepID=UPI0010353BF7|nr:hypothetical protein [Klebsiella pneumoniae]MDE9196941.1 hypothetical protein [Klebsiella pneumoniae]MDP1070288.1 hypothetical protein [Klebsiella pneumoniae]
MKESFTFLAAAYCSSEFSLAEQRCLAVPKNPHTERVAERSKILASDLACFLEENGYQIIMYAPNEPGKEPAFLLYRHQPLFLRGDAYFAMSGNGGLFIAPENFENDLTSVIEPNKDGVRLMAGKFDNDYGFEDLLKQVNMAKKYILENRLE